MIESSVGIGQCAGLGRDGVYGEDITDDADDREIKAECMELTIKPRVYKFKGPLGDTHQASTLRALNQLTSSGRRVSAGERGDGNDSSNPSA